MKVFRDEAEGRSVTIVYEVEIATSTNFDIHIWESNKEIKVKEILCQGKDWFSLAQNTVQ